AATSRGGRPRAAGGRARGRLPPPSGSWRGRSRWRLGGGRRPRRGGRRLACGGGRRGGLDHLLVDADGLDQRLDERRAVLGVLELLLLLRVADEPELDE